MQVLSSVWIWRDEKVRKNLDWYYKVSINKMPAKFLICSRIPCEVDLKEAGEDELWNEHERLSEIFSELYYKVRKDAVKITDLPKAEVSFLDLKAELANRILAHCTFCAWNCNVDRANATKHGTCQLESESRVGSFFHHFGEELPLRGRMGSGTIFFTSCNMRCVFCQNGDISHDKWNGVPFTAKDLAFTMKLLRLEGCHNVNLVGGEPTIHLHTIMEAISLLKSDVVEKPNDESLDRIARARSDVWFRVNPKWALYEGEFNVPILWNSNMFMSIGTMKLLKEVIDIWLPDFKFGNQKCAIRLSRTPWYMDVVTRNHKLIYEWEENIIIRHLVMPNHVECCTKPVLEWVASNMPDVLVNIMDQFHVDYLCDPSSPRFDKRYSDIARSPTYEEITEAYRYAKQLGLHFEPLSYEKNVYGLRV